MNEALGILEVTALTPTLVALDAMEKAANVRLVQCELNDFYGVCIKIAGPAATVAAALEAGRRIAETMGGRPIANIIYRCDEEAEKAIIAPNGSPPPSALASVMTSGATPSA